MSSIDEIDKQNTKNFPTQVSILLIYHPPPFFVSSSQNAEKGNVTNFSIISYNLAEKDLPPHQSGVN